MLPHYLLLLLGTTLVASVTIKGSPRRPLLTSIEDLISASSLIFIAYCKNLRPQVEGHSAISVHPMRSPCAKSDSIPSIIDLEFSADGQNALGEDVWEFAFKGSTQYIFFLEETMEKDVFRPLGAHESNKDEYNKFYHEFRRYFEGCWKASITFNSTATWYREPQTTNYQLAPGMTFSLNCSTRHPDAFSDDAFTGYHLTLFTPDGHRINKEPGRSLAWTGTLASPERNASTTTPRGEYQCVVAWPGEQLHLDAVSLNISLIDLERSPSLVLQSPLKVTHNATNIDPGSDKPRVAEWIMHYWSYPEPYFLWIHPNGTVLLNGTCSEITQDPEQCHEGVLTLQRKSPFSLVDGGNYTLILQAEGHSNCSEHTILDVLGAPVHTTVAIETTTNYVLIGQEINITCQSLGNPVPKLALFSCLNSSDCSFPEKVNELQPMTQVEEEGEIQVEGARVVRRWKVRAEVSSTYTCQAVNSLGNDTSPQVFLQVTAMEAPTWLSDIPLNITIDLHKRETLSLRCSASGIPAPVYQWSKDDVVLSAAEDDNLVVDEVTGVLLVEKAMKEDSGHYQCLVRNPAGTLLAWYEVTYVPPTHHSSLWVALGVLVPLLFLVTLTFFTRYFFHLRRSRQFTLRARKAWEKGNVASLNSDLCLHQQADLLPFRSKFEFSRDNITINKLLGCGAFGRVYRAVAENLGPEKVPTTVAVKMVKSRKDKTQLHALQSELKILMHIGRHVNIVNLVAACTKDLHDKGELMILVEYCCYGNILDYLRRNRNTFVNQLNDLGDTFLPCLTHRTPDDSRNSSNGIVYISVDRVAFQTATAAAATTANAADATATGGIHGEHMSQQPLLTRQMSAKVMTQRSEANTDLSDMTCLTLISDTHNLERPSIPCETDGRESPLCSRDLLCWAFQIARGMDYLAYRKVLHGDLAARNVLLTQGNVVKISDFGLAKNIDKYNNYKKNKNSPLPVKWMSLEALKEGMFSTQSDVWAYGVVLWEIFSLGCNPFPTVMMDETFIKSLEEGYRMDQPKFSTHALYQVMLECWGTNPDDRPSFSQLEQKLNQMLTLGDLQYFEELQRKCIEEAKEGEGEEVVYLNMVCSPEYNSLVQKVQQDDHCLQNDPSTATSSGTSDILPGANKRSPGAIETLVETKERDPWANNELLGTESNLLPPLKPQVITSSSSTASTIPPTNIFSNSDTGVSIDLAGGLLRVSVASSATPASCFTSSTVSPNSCLTTVSTIPCSISDNSIVTTSSLNPTRQSYSSYPGVSANRSTHTSGSSSSSTTVRTVSSSGTSSRTFSSTTWDTLSSTISNTTSNTISSESSSPAPFSSPARELGISHNP
ncbi:mast/stem cell growth factor receptor kita-like [Homarus americanus]|uniref:mast/stem cell growth factor receptor kita-like n=1 Tax=Homarus americanus TaxID=6706 RepID=UPI001C44A6BE|nr:mast/stem cell growth factor receptor kita-like [Homarus americanus]